MTRIIAISLALGLAACSNALTPAQTATAQSVIALASATVPDAAQIVVDGQLVCAGASAVNSIIDITTGKPFLVTGKAAQTVANVCSVLGAQPIPVPTGVAIVPKAVAIPA